MESSMDYTVILDQQAAIERTGCAALNEELLLCYDREGDWRKCKSEVKAFRECYKHFQLSLESKLAKKSSHDIDKPC